MFRAARSNLVGVSVGVSASVFGCQSRPTHRDDAASAPRPVAHDAAVDLFPELDRFPHVDPLRIIPLPARPNQPRFDVGGPIVAGGVAVVASSQFGFLGVDYHTGQIAWTKPAGEHVAPPLLDGNSVVLISDCIAPPDDVHDQLLGCARVVTPTGADESYVVIHGKATAFAAEPGLEHTWRVAEHRVAWRRGDQEVIVDLISGVATPAPAADPPLHVTYKDRAWDITHAEAGEITAQGKPPWHTTRAYTALIGAVYLPGQSPMVRAVNAGAFGGHPELTLFDIDATGSLHGQVAFPVPGVALLGQATDAIGDTALAVRLDDSLARDFIAGYAANALLMYVYALPHQQRAEPVGLALAPDALIAFHDGDTLTILPELSAPPTAPGAAKPPSENATP